MARLANRVVQVLATYATRPYTWGSIWVPIGCVAFAISVNKDDPQAFSLFAGFFVGTMFADVVRDQTRCQFAHPRSALLPGFAMPHFLAIVVFALCATVVAPAIITLTLKGNFLFMAACASFTFALLSRQYKFIHNQHIAKAFPTLLAVAILTVYLMTALRMWGSGNIALTSASSIALFVASWTFMAFNFTVQLVRLREDETSYQSWERNAGGRRLEAPSFFNVFGSDLKRRTRKRTLSDKWNDRIGGFHNGSLLRIIRLLRHGCGPWPPEFVAFGIFAFCAACAVLFIYASGQSDFPVLWRLFPVLIALTFPGPVAAGMVARPRSILAAELLRPLPRGQFIDALFAASLFTLALLWITFNTFAVWIFWTYPGLDPSLSRIPTFVLMSAGLSMASFGFTLYSPPLPIYVRILTPFFFLVVWFAVLPWWWFKRDATSDLPFLLISALALAVGLWATRQARLAWLNVELGINSLNHLRTT